MLTPDIDPIAFSIGPLAVRCYGLMYLVGFAAAWWLGKSRIGKGRAPVTREQFEGLMFLAVLGVILALRYRVDYLRLMDFIAPLVPLGIAAGRLGTSSMVSSTAG